MAYGVSVIEARGLARTFTTRGGPPVEAVRDVSFDVGEGELVAVLGPNGAGKSTTVRMLTTLLPPSAGTARVAGHDIVRDGNAVRRVMGYVGQGSGAGAYHRVRDELVTQGRAQRLAPAEAARRADELLAALELGGLGDRLVSTLSGGQKRRLDVALGLVHAPRVLFLDEPSTGLDPHSRANLWTHIQAQRAKHGTTILLTTHYLDEADAMADRVIVIDHGRVIANDTPARLKAELAGDRLSIGLRTPDEACAAMARARELDAIREATTDGSRVTAIARDGDRVLPDLIRALDSSGLAVTSAAVRHPTLDDVFLGLTGRSLRDAEAA